MLADRYRIVALLGRGGMGEVYRADDLTLGQPVALKFLPEEAAQGSRLCSSASAAKCASRARSRIPTSAASTTSAKSTATLIFTMEYVDGEDLASLLRRIGRLPTDKAIEIARQLCAGLAAAHAKGVLHRDLKPANIMIDGRGQAVITDFGLAALADQAHGAEVRSGTPAYMAPEQLAGKEVTEKSDHLRARPGALRALHRQARVSARTIFPSWFARALRAPSAAPLHSSKTSTRWSSASSCAALKSNPRIVLPTRFRSPPPCPAEIRWPPPLPPAKRLRRKWSPPPARSRA